MAIVDLNRRFHEWNDRDLPDPDVRIALGLDDGGVGWEHLLTKRRAVVLAEAGSGKSTEFLERAKLTTKSHAYVFHASVEDVGHEGLDGALSPDARRELAAWRQGVEDSWFFIDSVDEAKVVGIRFEKVVRKLAEGVHGAEERCHILLSGRVTDWEPRRDLEALQKWLRVSSIMPRPGPTPEEELLRIIRNERTPEEVAPSDETPFVAIMAPLDRERVRLFAEATGAPRTEQFLKAIDDANLWHFARRPLDLEWLVRFWRSEERLGTLQEMVERSIIERLKETNHNRSRIDDLRSVEALRAVERIGAAMVFGRKTTLAIPDRGADRVSDTSLDLADILPEWSDDERFRLLTRPVFDPATLGRAQFHNDNYGTVRSYLAARWLVRLRKANLSTAGLFRLLFANSYGVEVIRPSLNETTAWLCLWDNDVANEVVRLAPGVLMDGGDPASLAANIRSAALAALLRDLTTDEQECPWWDNDKLRRFAQPGLGVVVQALWPQYAVDRNASQLLMRLTWLGALKECGTLARDVTFDKAADPTLRVFAGKALLAIGDYSTRFDYAALIKTESAILPLRMIGDSIATLFPTFLNTSDVLRILSSVNIEDDQNGLGFESEGPSLIKKLESTADLDLFLTGLLRQLGTELGEHSHYPPTRREEVFFPAMAEAALGLLKAAPSNSAPDASVDALLRICNRRERSTSVRQRASEALRELHRTAARRRHAFWRVVSILRAASPRQWIDQPSHIASLGFPVNLEIEDAEWLLADGVAKGGMDCTLAVNTALLIYRRQGEPASLFSRISAVAESNPIGHVAFVKWAESSMPSQFEVEMGQVRREKEEQNQADLDEQDQSWISFIRDVKSNPERIAKLEQPDPNDQNSDLMKLWRLLHWAGGQSRYAIGSVAPLERIAGIYVAKAVESGLIAHWRICKPLIRSRRAPKERDSTQWVHLMGLTGVTLEATRDPTWATKLSDDEVRTATEFATLEINGFPRWLSDLVATSPAEVRTVLHHEITDELTIEVVTFCETLQAVMQSGEELASLLAPVLLEDLEGALIVPPGVLFPFLKIIVDGLAESERARFARCGIERFEQEPNVAVAVQYLAAVFHINPKAATAVLKARVAAVDEEAQTALVDRFLAACFGDSFSATTFQPVPAIPPDIIEQLMLLSFRTYKLAALRQPPASIVYRINDVDLMARARSAVFGRFVETPGPATYHALRRLQQEPSFPLKPSRLRTLAERRASEDSEGAPWHPRDAHAFEQSNVTAPRTGKDLRAVVVGRISDMQHDLLHGDFSQAETLRRLSSEKEVQKWVANLLRLKEGRSFSVEREPHVVDEKEPDIQIKAKATDANVSIEIKLVESWTLRELDDALEVQLCGQYLRSDRGRYGVFLLVHREGRSRGWEDKAVDKYLSFAQVVDRLQARALAISGGSYNAPQPEVAVLDVTTASFR